MLLDTIHSGCHHTTLNTLEWKGERIHTSATILYAFLLQRLNRTAVRMVTPLFLTGPLQPWQTLTLLSIRLTKVTRTFLQLCHE